MSGTFCIQSSPLDISEQVDLINRFQPTKMNIIAPANSVTKHRPHVVVLHRQVSLIKIRPVVKLLVVVSCG